MRGAPERNFRHTIRTGKTGELFETSGCEMSQDVVRCCKVSEDGATYCEML